MKSFFDGLDGVGRRVVLEQPPQRVVSLVPSQTELLFDLGVGHRVVGVTRYCVRPPVALETKVDVGGTKRVHLDRVAGLQSDLVLANQEENTAEDVDALAALSPVYVTDVRDLDSAEAMIRTCGALFEAEAKATALAEEISRQFEALSRRWYDAGRTRLSAVYLIWRRPWMGVGGDTFIHDLMTRAGLDNLLSEQRRYPELSTAELVELDPSAVLLSSEPFPFAQGHVDELQQILPRAAVVQVDGELFSWYGSRLLETPEYLEGVREDLGRRLEKPQPRP